MSLSSQLGLNDMEALLWGPPYLTADHLGSVLDEDGDEVLPEGAPSPFSSSYYADTSPSPLPAVLSPPSPSITGCKMGTELPPLPWLSADELLASTMCADGGKEDAFTGMEWMTEKIDLSEFDLDSLMGSCDSDEPRSPPDDLIASLECHMDLDLTAHSSFMTTSASHKEEINVSLSEVSQVPLEQPQKEVEVKSEPLSPVLLPPPSPSFTLELGSEVDVSESEKVALTDKVQAPKIILSLPPSLVVVLAPAPKELATVSTAIASGSDDQSDSDSGFGSDSGSSQNHSCSTPPPGSTGTSRTKPYSAPSKSKPALESVTLTGKVKSASGAPRVVEKKLKKMEQNKTAATRYRQKKRAEQEALSSECSELEQKNRELEEKADSISKEIQYLKDLIEEVRKAKSKKNEGGGK